MSETKGLVTVTGGSRAIGAAICRRLATDGYAIAVNYAPQPAAAEAVVAEIKRAAGRAHAVAGDVADEAAIRSLFEQAQTALGPLVGLVNNAGIVGASTRFADLTAEVLNRTLAVNVVGTVLCAREAVRILSTQHGGSGGVVFNLGSVATRLSGPGELVHYATSKGAIDTFTLGLAREVAEEGIRVNAVAPGLIDTEMNSSDRQLRISPNIPMKRVGAASEVAEAVAWLMSPASSYVTWIDPNGIGQAVAAIWRRLLKLGQPGTAVPSCLIAGVMLPVLVDLSKARHRAACATLKTEIGGWYAETLLLERSWGAL
jgi:NAD(P)-dependent dehydrogenase (short-subunit alcohol dehydrogenase family)